MILARAEIMLLEVHKVNRDVYYEVIPILIDAKSYQH